MEADFSIRKELESISHGDAESAELLSQYYGGVTQKANPSTGLIGTIASLLSNNHNTLRKDMEKIRHQLGNTTPPASVETGVSLNIGSETLRWIVLFIFILALLFVVYKLYARKRRKKNPFKRQLLDLEQEVVRLKRKNPLPEITYNDDIDD